MSKILVGVFAVLSMGILGSGCGGGGSGGSDHPAIIVNGGLFGYYIGNEFCNINNNYCGTGNSYGISNNGCSYNGNSCFYYGPIMGNPVSGGNGSGNAGGNIPINGPIVGGPIHIPYNPGNPTYPVDPYYPGNPVLVTINNPTGGMQSVDEDTKDVNLQKGEVLSQAFESRVQANVQQYSMSVESARSLTQLSDRMNMLSNQGQLTDADRDALAHSALAVAGVNDPKAVSDAVAKMANHDNSAINTLIDKAAVNLGMPSSAGLRDQILPSFGIQIPQN